MSLEHINVVGKGGGVKEILVVSLSSIFPFAARVFVCSHIFLSTSPVGIGAGTLFLDDTLTN